MVCRHARHEKRGGKTARRKKTLVPADFPDMHDATVVARQSKSDLRVLPVTDLSITAAVMNMPVELL